jgi:integrase
MDIKLTKTKVDNISFPKSGQVFYRDSVLEGFGLRVGKSTKAYYAEKRVKGKTVRKTIGRHGKVTCEQARKKAQELLGMMSMGRNPIQEEMQEKIMSVTLQEAFDEYIETRKSLKPRTIEEYKNVISKCFDDWKDRSLTEITKDMVAKRHSELGNRSHARANLAMRILSAVVNFAIGRYENSQGQPILTENPVKRLSQTRAWYRVNRRQTVIRPHELPALFECIQKLKESATTPRLETVPDYILFLLFTGLRRREGARLTWDQIDFQSKTMTITDTKNNEPLTLPLSDFLFDMFNKRHENRVNEYVFPGKKRYLENPNYSKVKITELSGVSFTLHDLRRTFITIAESLDISAYALKRLLNHKMSGDVTAGYIIPDVERLRKPMQKITDYILSKAGVKEKAEVVDLDSRRVVGT